MVESLSKGRRGEFNLGVGVTQKWQQSKVHCCDLRGRQSRERFIPHIHSCPESPCLSLLNGKAVGRMGILLFLLLSSVHWELPVCQVLEM